MKIPKSIDTLSQEIAKLPSIGKKTAQRLAFFLIKDAGNLRSTLAHALIHADEYHTCRQCFCLMDDDICPICSDTERDQSLICVVEEYLDLIAIENTGGYRGLYHVLGGVLSPLESVGPKNLHINDLLTRLDDVKEVIVATNTTMEGEATGLFIKRQVQAKNADIHISRIARGLPIGADVEYADSVTLSSAFEGRRLL